jgi:hypothetical protein
VSLHLVALARSDMASVPTSVAAVLSTIITNLPAPHTALTIDATATPTCTATVAIGHSIQCYGPDGWTESTAVPYYVDCLGCATATPTYRPECCCPLGGYPPLPPPLISQTSTSFNFVCSPTPPSPSIHNPADSVTTLPAPTFAPTALPEIAYTPVGVVVSFHAQGWCEVQVSLTPNPASTGAVNADAYSSSFCAQSSGGAAPSSWASTSTTTIGVDCGACETPWRVNWAAGDPGCGDRYGATSTAPLVPVSGVTTTWAYACSTALASASCTSAPRGRWCVNARRTYLPDPEETGT